MERMYALMVENYEQGHPSYLTPPRRQSLARQTEGNFSFLLYFLPSFVS